MDDTGAVIWISLAAVASLASVIATVVAYRRTLREIGQDVMKSDYPAERDKGDVI